ncbi:hypothetical protein VBD025_00465 [Virgibacillus flavescens]|uniref:hypothetical protein n=1 Tax=Virgibacillus flavescens TaxID=1611422 RepID=UPI003D324C77
MKHNNFEKRQSSVSDSGEMNDRESRKTKKVFYSPNINSETSSKPVIFPPPKVLDQEFKEKRDMDYYYKKLDPKPKKTSKPVNRKKQGSPKSLTEFNFKFKERSATQDKSSINSEQFSTSQEPVLEDEIAANDELDSPNKKESEAVNEIISVADDQSSAGKGQESSLLDEFKNLLNEGSSFQDKVSPSEKDGDTEGNSASLNVEESTKDKPFAKTESEIDASSKQKDSLVEEFTSMLEEPSSITDQATDQEELPSEEALHESDEASEDKTESTIIEHCTKVEKNKWVKLPVLLAKVNFDIDILRSFDFTCSVENVTKIDWSIESLVMRTLLPSNRVFFKGVLIAEVEYVNEKTKMLHTIKLPILWDKVVDVSWITSPEEAVNDQKEYTFQSHGHETSTHYEYSQTFADHIEENLRSINFIWHNNSEVQSDSPKLHIEGRANVSIDLLQQQFINLNSIGHMADFRNDKS